MLQILRQIPRVAMMQLVSPPLTTRCTSTRMNAEKIAIATTMMVSINAGICNQMLAKEATINRMTPTNRNLPMLEKSFLETVAMEAITVKMAAVPPKAPIIRVAPLLQLPRVIPIRRESITPIKKVNASKSTTPIPVSLFFSIAQKKPKATAKKIIAPINGLPSKKVKPMATPNHAPMTVGTMESAKRAQVFLRTRLRDWAVATETSRPKPTELRSLIEQLL